MSAMSMSTHHGNGHILIHQYLTILIIVWIILLFLYL